MHSRRKNDATAIGDVLDVKQVMLPCSTCGEVDVLALIWPGGKEIRQNCAACRRAEDEARANKARQESLARANWLRTPEGQKNIGIPEQFFDATIDECPEKVELAVKALYRGQTKVRSVVLQGDMGSGKTRLTYALIRQAHLDGQPEAVQRVPCGELVMKLRGTGLTGLSMSDVLSS